MAERLHGVLLAVSGEDADLLRAIDAHGSGLRVVRRCADTAELLSAAMAGLAALVVVDTEFDDLDLSVVDRLARAGATGIVLTSADQAERWAVAGWSAEERSIDPGAVRARLQVLAHAVENGPPAPTMRVTAPSQSDDGADDQLWAELAAIDAANRASGASYVSASGFRNPLDIPIVVTSPFGMRYHPVLGVMKGHSGTDMAADCGTIIRAVASGYVNAVSSDVSAGNYVDINHGLVGGNSVITEYLHMQAQYVSPGQYVNAGDALGEVGSTGYATGCHLHFGVLQNGSYVEPMDYL